MYTFEKERKKERKRDQFWLALVVSAGLFIATANRSLHSPPSFFLCCLSRAYRRNNLKKKRQIRMGWSQAHVPSAKTRTSLSKVLPFIFLFYFLCSPSSLLFCFSTPISFEVKETRENKETGLLGIL